VSRKIGEAALAKVSAEVLEEEDWKEELMSKMQLLNNSTNNNKLKKSKGKTSKGKGPSTMRPGRDRSTSDPGNRRKRAATIDSKFFYCFCCLCFCLCF
jgi:hypothetical protein